jgi:DNA transposition AAA+ family ATPase
MEPLKITPPIQQPEKKNVILSTANFQAIQKACTDAMVNQKLIALNGETGYGKSLALQYFRAHNKNTFMITAKPSMGAKAFWLEILQAIYKAEGYPEKTEYRPLYFILRRVSDALNRLGNSLIIVDEAGKLTDRLLEFMHEVRDQTEGTTGIVLAGPNYFKSNLVKWVSRERKGIPEFYSRINYWLELQPPTALEINKICEAYEITNTEIVRVLQMRCKNFRALRNELTELLASNSPDIKQLVLKTNK